MTPSELIHMGVRADRAAAFAGPLTVALAEFDITTPQRTAAFLAQILHESGALRYTKEIWGPTPDQATYERDFTQPWGPGLKRGDRNHKAWQLGNLQATGRDNYSSAGRALGEDLTRYPEALESPLLAARSAGYFWQSHHLNDFADMGDMLAITRKINGGVNGLAARGAYYLTALEVLT